MLLNSEFQGMFTTPLEKDDEILDLFESTQDCWVLVLEYFNGDKVKARLWFNTPNPLLGDIVPYDMILIGRGKKLLKLIENQISGNAP